MYRLPFPYTLRHAGIGIGGVCIDLRCDIATLKSSQPVVPVAMSKEIEADEIEQLVTEAVNVEAIPSVTSGIVGDLLTGELDSWRVVICRIKKDDDDLLVCGEDGQVVERVETDVWTTSGFYDTAVKDLSRIADAINEAIAREYGEL